MKRKKIKYSVLMALAILSGTTLVSISSIVRTQLSSDTKASEINAESYVQKDELVDENKNQQHIKTIIDSDKKAKLYIISSDYDVTQKISNDIQIIDFIIKNDLNLNGNDLVELAKIYDIEPAFLLATWILETGWGTSLLWNNKNNAGGIVCNNDYCDYENQFTGLAALAQLTNSYTEGSISFVGKRVSVKEIREKWSESEDAETIIGIMNMILRG